MAIVNTAGTIYVDVAGVVSTSRTKVSYILFTSTNSTATVQLRDGTSSSSPIKFTLHLHTSNHMQVLDFSRLPVIFNNGIYCSGISAGDTVSIVTTSVGSNS